MPLTFHFQNRHIILTAEFYILDDQLKVYTFYYLSVFLRIPSLLIVILAFASIAEAQNDLNSAFRFLNIPSSARAAAMGGVNVALPDADVTHFQMNPAYLTDSDHNFFGISYLNHLADVNMGFASGAYHIDHVGTVGVGIRFVGYGEIAGVTADGVETGTFQPFDLALTTTLGRAFNESLHYGVSLNIIHSSYDIYNSTAVALSFGALYTFDVHTVAGFTVNNAGTQITAFNEQKERLPLDIRLGVTRSLEHLPFRLSLTAHSLNRWNMQTFSDEEDPEILDNILRRLIIGGELLLSENVNFRLGYNNYMHQELKAANRVDLAGFSIGLGLQIRGFHFDVSRSSYSDSGGLTQLSIQTRL